MNIQLFTEKPTKSAVSTAADLYVTQVLEGGDVHCAWLEAKWYEELAGAIMDRLKEHVIAAPEADSLRMGGAKITISQRRDYDYTHDITWLSLKAEEAQAAQSRKEREKFLQTLPVEMADTDTGEVIKPAVLLGVKSIVSTTLPK